MGGSQRKASKSNQDHIDYKVRAKFLRSKKGAKEVCMYLSKFYLCIYLLESCSHIQEKSPKSRSSKQFVIHSFERLLEENSLEFHNCTNFVELSLIQSLGVKIQTRSDHDLEDESFLNSTELNLSFSNF